MFVNAGETIIYLPTFVENTGNVTLTNLSVLTTRSDAACATLANFSVR